MIKYIRNTDNVVFKSDGVLAKGYEHDGYQVSDSLEDLCDRCVVKLKYEKQPFIGSFYEFEHFINQYVKKIPSNNPVTDIFGAIWTDEGLIYKAKMNEEGKLELIC